MQCLVERLQKNDEAAFEEIYYLLHRKIYHFVLRYVRDGANAQELTQLFFVRVWEKRQKLDPGKSLESQAFVIARNLVIDELRKKTREAAFRTRYQVRGNSAAADTEDTVLYHNLRDHFEAAIEALPPKRKEIFRLSRQLGLSYGEIAQRLSISPKTVETQMGKALKVVRSKLSSFLHILL